MTNPMTDKQPRVRCHYCRSDACDHPARLEELRFITWLLERIGRDVLHVFAREEHGYLTYDCVVCGKQHRHGAGVYGSRVTHCPVGVPMTVVLHPEGQESPAGELWGQVRPDAYPWGDDEGREQ